MRIGAYEGIVEEVTINYTRLYGPDRTLITLANQRVLFYEIINYRVKEIIHTGPMAEKAEEKESETKSKKSRRIFSRSKVGGAQPISIKPLYRYTFTVSVKRDYFDEKEVEGKFEEVCEKWKSKFGYKPTYQLWSAGSDDVNYFFSITVREPIKLIEFRSDFYRDILKATGPIKK